MAQKFINKHQQVSLEMSKHPCYVAPLYSSHYVLNEDI